MKLILGWDAASSREEILIIIAEILSGSISFSVSNALSMIIWCELNCPKTGLAMLGATLRKPTWIILLALLAKGCSKWFSLAHVLMCRTPIIQGGYFSWGSCSCYLFNCLSLFTTGFSRTGEADPAETEAQDGFKSNHCNWWNFNSINKSGMRSKDDQGNLSDSPLKEICNPYVVSPGCDSRRSAVWLTLQCLFWTTQFKGTEHRQKKLVFPPISTSHGRIKGK